MRLAQILLAMVASFLVTACGTLTVMPTRSSELYVTNSNPDGIAVFDAGATGNVAPIRRISGAASLLALPRRVALDGAGNLYVANYGTDTLGYFMSAYVSVYAPASNGNVPPIRVIYGVAPGGIGDMAVDDAGSVYVSDVQNNTINIYLPGTTGNVPPSRTITGAATGLGKPVGLAVDHAGTLYVLNPGTSSLTVYAPGASGNAVPIRTISGPNVYMSFARDLAVDSEGKLYVTDFEHHEASVDVYAAGASGNAAPIRVIRRIYGTMRDVAVDLAGHVYLSERWPPDEYWPGVSVFSPTPDGSDGPADDPVRRIVGAATTLTNPSGVALWPW